MQRMIVTAMLAAGAAGALWGQAAHIPSFEVVSVKVNALNGPLDFVPRRSGDRVAMHNTQLAQVIMFAWHIPAYYELAGKFRLPDGWNWYDIEAIAPGSPSEDDLRLMFQSLLEDRFKLKAHRETRELTTYDLVLAKGGSKMQTAHSESKITVDGRPIGAGSAIAFGADGAHLVGKGATMEQLVASLSGRMSAPVRDRTGLTGTFDYSVVFARDDNPADMSGLPVLTTAIQNDLGLKLVVGKGPVEVLIVDHVEKPSAN